MEKCVSPTCTRKDQADQHSNKHAEAGELSPPRAHVDSVNNAPCAVGTASPLGKVGLGRTLRNHTIVLEGTPTQHYRHLSRHR
eukprot:478958-Pleurochrysis_carterae.AAC.2